MPRIITLAVTLDSTTEDIPQLLHDAQKIGIVIGKVEFESDNFSWDER
jgi:hypothetical protein